MASNLEMSHWWRFWSCFDEVAFELGRAIKTGDSYEGEAGAIESSEGLRVDAAPKVAKSGRENRTRILTSRASRLGGELLLISRI